jgi:hypothetical protein
MRKKIKKISPHSKTKVDLRKVKELCRLLKVESEEEAIRVAVEESFLNHRAARSLNRFLDAFAQEQSHAGS